MAARGGPQTWRLVRLARWTPHLCPHCGADHEYLTRPARGQDCQPVLFPPGLRAGGALGVEVAACTAGPADLPDIAGHDTPYQRAARRVAATAIRCERCGTLFEDLDTYVDHPC